MHDCLEFVELLAPLFGEVQFFIPMLSFVDLDQRWSRFSLK